MSQEKPEALRNLLNQHIAKKFKDNRKLLGISQTQMGKALSTDTKEIDYRTIQRWEKGENAIPAWVIEQQKLMIAHFAQADDNIKVKEKVLTALEDSSHGFFPELRKKLKLWLKG